MTESLTDLMIIRKEIEGIELEIAEGLKNTGLDTKMRRVDLLKKMLQAALKDNVSAGITREGEYKIVNVGRKTRKINIKNLRRSYPDVFNILEDGLTISLKDASTRLEDAGLNLDVLDEVCDLQVNDRYDIVDLMEG
jgi:hypothetical protein